MKSKNRLAVKLPGLDLKNPIIPSSGTFGFGYEFARFYDLNVLGSMALKGTTLEPRYGNPLPRIAETPAGMINAIGLQNPGASEVVEVELEKLRPHFAGKVLINVSGNTLEDYLAVVKIFANHDMVGALEINVSCPNVACGGMMFGFDPKVIENLTKKVKALTKKAVYVKLTPNVSDIVAVARGAEAGGADGISLINTLLGARFDLKTGRPIIANRMGGVSGPVILPVALRCVYQVSQVVKIPVIGMGGVSSAQDVIEMMMAGASAVQVGTANLIDPYACPKIIDNLPEVLDKLGYDKITDVIGLSHMV